MPQSKKRPHPHPQQHHSGGNNPADKKFNKVVKVAIIFFAVIGLFISLFITGPNVLSQIIGIVIGGVGGYFFGQQMHTTFYKK
ncbi:hypothetical protein LK994_09255 [Ferruginibacter lapsinanis]|uniref:hypothetical protein n=1 Tax=Ferruginibacter lapsinanis TaxID=563172 RepID=UPI001E4456A6|nr:hypothetical protein [Ferruginibacter lapsinanis]UEG48822.1 hypothetical protein LK994_09255 [Ferruginibacter lapsinanis]